MSAKHTPGPWKWHPKFIIGERNGSVYAEPNDGHAYAIAMQPRYVSDEQWAADARLIAAAPDLLANAYAADTCLSVAWGYARELGKHEEANHILEVQQSVRAALAAATGEKHEQ